MSHLIFLHVPKTAGTTLVHIIEQNYPQRARYALGSTECVTAFGQLDVAHRRRVRILMGHMPFGAHHYFDEPAAYFTFLRDPIDRAISFFHYVRHNPEHYLNGYVLRDDLTLLAFLERRATLMMDNFQTRLISGVGHDAPYGAYPADMLEQAKQNLRTAFTVVGLTERFDESLLLLRAHFGWRRLFYTRQNVTAVRPPKASVDPATLAALQAANQLDSELYAYAQELFAAQIADQGPHFPRRLALFQATNRVFAAYRQLRRVSARAYLRRWLQPAS